MKLIFIIHLFFTSTLIGCKNNSQVEINTAQSKEIQTEKTKIAPIQESEDIVVQWMETAATMRLGWYERTQDNARADATLALAMFETANAITQEYPSYLGILKTTEKLPVDIAVSAAAAKVLSLLYPDRANLILKTKQRILSSTKTDQNEKQVIALGEEIAQKAFNRGKKTEVAIPLKYPITQPARSIAASGVYVPEYERSAIRDFDLAYVPWTLSSQDQLRPLPPPALSSKIYAQAYKEVKEIGQKKSNSRTVEQTESADFWFLIEMNPILRNIAESPNRSLTRNARMYTMFHIVTDDSWVAAADAKQYYQFWRPITAIGQANEDGNTATQPSENWLPLSPTPPHPEYPCGHCVQAAAQQTVLIQELSNPNQVFKLKSSGAPNAQAREVTLNDYVSQTLSSRLYAGAHFRFSNEAGKDLGQKVAQQVLERWSKL